MNFARGPNQIENRIEYKLFLSKRIDDALIKTYEDHVIASSGGQLTIFGLKEDPDTNACYGAVQFDENIEEEWLVVYSLFELSKFDHDLVIKIRDSDGDILLIEAAEHLPRWLESKRSKDRTYIHRGNIHIIPKDVDLKNLPGGKSNVTLSATRFIRDMNNTSSISSNTSLNFTKVKTVARPNIQAHINSQLCGLPDKTVWLKKRFEQLQEMIRKDDNSDNDNILKNGPEGKLSIATVMAMRDEDLRTSPISSTSSSSD